MQHSGKLVIDRRAVGSNRQDGDNAGVLSQPKSNLTQR